MNRQQRRAMGLTSATQDEPKRVTVRIEEGKIILSMIGVTSKVASHAILSPETSTQLGEALIAAPKKVNPPKGLFERIGIKKR